MSYIKYDMFYLYMGFKSDNTIRNYEKQRTRDMYGAKKRKLLKEQEDDKSKVKGVVSTTV